MGADMLKLGMHRSKNLTLLDLQKEARGEKPKPLKPHMFSCYWHNTTDTRRENNF